MRGGGGGGMGGTAGSPNFFFLNQKQLTVCFLCFLRFCVLLRDGVCSEPSQAKPSQAEESKAKGRAREE